MQQQLTITKEQLAKEVEAVNFEELETSIKENLIREYNCQTTTERSAAHIAAISYIRYLDVQEQIRNSNNRMSALWYCHDNCINDGIRPYSPKNACKRNEFELLRYGVLSKESDRAYRQYLGAVQTLRQLKQMPLNITIKTQTAIVGQNQMVQSNNHEGFNKGL